MARPVQQHSELPGFGTARHARFALAVLLIVAIVSLVAPTGRVPRTQPEGGDSTTYERMIEQLKAGGAYYDTIGAQLRARGYATVEIFNWRTPLFLTFLARVPRPAAELLLVGLGAALLVSTWRILRDTSLEAAWSGTVLQAGAVVNAVIPPSLLMSEAWSGLLVGLSVCAFARGRRTTGVALGTLALFVRELAGAYCLVCAGLALRQRRWRDVKLWVIAAAMYAVYYSIHLAHLLAHREPGDIALASSWLSVSGVPFLLAAVGWHAWLVLLPGFVTRLTLPLIVSGLWSRRMVDEGRAALAAYLFLFLVAGQPFDAYWGAMAWPVWAMGAGYGIEVIRDAVHASRLGPSMPARIDGL
jgi:hypothetical protein